MNEFLKSKEYKIGMFVSMCMCTIVCIGLCFIFENISQKTYLEIPCTLIQIVENNDGTKVGIYEGIFDDKTYIFRSNKIKETDIFYIDENHPKIYHQDNGIWKNGFRTLSKICIYIGMVCFLFGVFLSYPFENTKIGKSIHFLSMICMISIFSYCCIILANTP